MQIIPLFTSAYSFKSILSIKKKKKADSGSSDSIIEICKENDIKKLFLIEENMIGFLEAKNECPEDVDLAFGLRILFCNDISASEEEVKASTCKYVILANNDEGYFALLKLFNFLNEHCVVGKETIIDFKTIKKNNLWNENLSLVVPFYDSFIYKNLLEGARCIPDFSFIDPVFFIEDSGLFFDEVIEEGIRNFDKDDKFEKVKTRSIYYKNREDFMAYQTYRCILSKSFNRATLRMPNLDYCYSDSFCLEAWKEQNS